MKGPSGRQPILDRQERVSAYELLFRSSTVNRAEIGDPSFATASVILGVLAGFGVQQILGGHRGFINVDREFLFSDAVVERCRRLASAGFKLALDDHQFDPAFERLYRLVEIVKVDLTLPRTGSLAPGGGPL